jgi:molybdate transport system ATP-binding protein
MTVSVSLQQSFPGFELDVDFEVSAGLTVLFGGSGSGKTTIINAVAGLLNPNQGRVVVEDQVLLDTAAGIWLQPHQRKLGYIFQEARLFPHLTVCQNLAYGHWFARRRKGSDKGESTDRVVEMLGIRHLLDRRPARLSGGERQRVAIGRALLARPRLILADEPLAALDEARKSEILPYFERLRDELSIPILYVSHSATEVARLATTVVVIQDGKVAGQGGAADVLSDPMVTPTGVRGVGAVLQARVRAHHADGLSELEAGGVPLLVPGIGQVPGQDVRVRISAHEVILSRTKPEGLSALNILPGRIEAIRPGGGPGAIVSLETPAGRILARVTQRSADALGLRVGVECYAVIKTVGIAREDVSGAV